MGKVIMSGVAPNMTIPGYIRATDIAVGSIVKLKESYVDVEYIVINQGIPQNSSLYDDSCDGVWILRKEIFEKKTLTIATGSSSTFGYVELNLDDCIQSEFYDIVFDSKTKSAIKEVRIPYVKSTNPLSINSGKNGLLVNAFPLSCYEVGITNTGINTGARLEYFDVSDDVQLNSKRRATYQGSLTKWALRDVYWYSGQSSNRIPTIQADGTVLYETSGIFAGIRPAMILSKTALFDKNLVLKGTGSNG